MHRSDEADEGAERPIAVLVEWSAPAMTVREAMSVAEQSAETLHGIDGLLDARFFGDFESGTHYFLLTWRDRRLMDTYMSSEAMQSVRGAAAPFVSGAPSRRVFVDYGPGASDSRPDDG